MRWHVTAFAIVFAALGGARASDGVSPPSESSPETPAQTGMLVEDEPTSEARSTDDESDGAHADDVPSSPSSSSVRAPDAVPHEARMRRQILVLTPSASETLEPVAESVASLVAAKVGSYPTLDVVTSNDVTKLLSLEADRQLLDCSDTSCAAEIAEAMGASLVVFGDVTRLGTALVVTLSLFDSDTAMPIGRVVAQTTSEATLASTLDPKIEALLANLPDVGEPTLTLEDAVVPASTVPVAPLAVVGVGIATFVTGLLLGAVVAAVPYALAWAALQEGDSALSAPHETEAERRAAEEQYAAAEQGYALAQSLETPALAVSAALFTVSLAGLATALGGAWWAFAPEGDE